MSDPSRSRMRLPEIRCKKCKQLFHPKRSWQLFCTNKCRNFYHNRLKLIKETYNKQVLKKETK